MSLFLQIKAQTKQNLHLQGKAGSIDPCLVEQPSLGPGGKIVLTDMVCHSALFFFLTSKAASSIEASEKG
jgi:hypothetical protein